MVRTAVEIMFPGPMVLERHQLVNVSGPTINEPFILRVEALGEFSKSCGLIGNGTARHRE
jgi:hypothetical protein